MGCVLGDYPREPGWLDLLVAPYFPYEVGCYDSACYEGYGHPLIPAAGALRGSGLVSSLKALTIISISCSRALGLRSLFMLDHLALAD